MKVEVAGAAVSSAWARRGRPSAVASSRCFIVWFTTTDHVCVQLISSSLFVLLAT